MKQGRWQEQALYCFASWCLSPLVFAHLLWRTVHDGGLLYLRQRLGLKLPSCENPLWIHAASVGEINTVAPLIHAIHASFPDRNILVTTNTPTGRAALQRSQVDFAAQAYLPLDYPFAVRRFLRANQIQCGLIVETEIWPILLEYCPFPLAIVNGRLSSRTLGAGKDGAGRKETGRIATIYRRAVSHIDLVLARSEADAAGFVRLGIPANHIHTTGNLKFASLPGAGPDPDRTADSPRLVSRTFCLLASTHEDEEAQLAALWLARRRTELLVIAPRHPDRRAALIKQLGALTDQLAVRSSNDRVDNTILVYLADTLGEMDNWFQHAGAIFMGGSLVPKGGHNMIEPARAAQSVVTGPYNSNFEDELAAFLAEDAIKQVDSASEVIDALVELLDSEELTRARGERARAVAAANAVIGQRYMDALAGFLAGAQTDFGVSPR